MKEMKGRKRMLIRNSQDTWESMSSDTHDVMWPIEGANDSTGEIRKRAFESSYMVSWAIILQLGNNN